MALAPQILNTTHRFGHKADSHTWANLQAMLYGPQIGVVPRFEAKAYMDAVKQGLDFLKASGFASVSDLDKIQEVNLALFYYVGMGYFHAGFFDDALVCLTIVYSQARFLDRILPDFESYPKLAGKLLSDVREGKSAIPAIVADNEPTREDIEAFLKKQFGKSGKSGKSGCFVATAACDDPFAPEVIALSAFRDDILLHHRIGRAFVRRYYAVSPPIAAMIAQSVMLRRIAMTLAVRPATWLVRTIRDSKDGR